MADEVAEKPQTVADWRISKLEEVTGRIEGKLDTFLDKFATKEDLKAEIDHLDQKHSTAIRAVADDLTSMKTDAERQSERTQALEDAKRGRRSTWAIFWATTAVTVFGGGFVALFYELVQAAQHLTGSTH